MAPLNPHAPPFKLSPNFDFSSCLPQKKPQHLRVGTVNACSWYPKADEISHLMITTNVDVLCITESWLQPHIPDTLLLPTSSHNIIRRDRPIAATVRGGGVAFLLHPAVQYQSRPDLQPTNPTIEILCLQILSSGGPTYAFACYRSPRTDSKLFLTELRSLITRIPEPNAHILLLGDFNARLAEWNSTDPNTPEGRALASTLDDLSLTQLIRQQSTRFSACGRKASLLDLAISNKPFLVSNISILPSVSDHCPVIVDILVHTPRLPNANLCEKCYDYSQVDWQALNNYLWSLPLSEIVEQEHNVNEAWELWKHLVECAIECFIPVRQRRFFPKNKPWFTSIHHRLKRKRDRLFAAAKRTGTCEAWAMYRIARNGFKSQLRRAKKQFMIDMSNDLSATKRGSYNWWCKAKRACKITKSIKPIPDLVLNGDIAHTNRAKANVLASVFAKSSTPTTISNTTNLKLVSSKNKLTIESFTGNVVFRHLSKLSCRRSTSGSLTNRILKETAEVTTQSLTTLFNKCTEMSSFPHEWLIATVTPIYKGRGGQDNPANYRPISVLNGVGKVYESLISEQFYNFVESNNIISENQFGFRRKRSTVDHLVTLTSTVFNGLDHRQLCDAVFLDLSKAFDRADHSAILLSMSAWCTESTLAWIRNFMTQRSMRVKVGSDISPMYPLAAGVPQGSHLGPLLFNILIDTLPSRLSSCRATLFADDTTVTRVSLPKEDLSSHTRYIQHDLNICEIWAKESAAQFNAKKSLHMPFVSASSLRTGNLSPRVLFIARTELYRPAVIRHLGVLLTPSLNFSQHIVSITAKYRSRVFLLCNMAQYLPFSAINLLYKCYVRPTIEYALPVWLLHIDCHQVLTFDKLQASAARALLFCKLKQKPDWLTPKESLNRMCDWASLQWRRHVLGLVYYHHVYYHFFSLLDGFGFQKSRNSRHSTSIILPRAGSTFVKSFLFQFSIAWNKLPETTRCLTSPSKFKRQIRKDFISYKFKLSGLSHLFS